MQTRQVVSLISVIAVIALALGTTIGFSVSSGRTSTLTQTRTVTTSVSPGNSSTTTSNSISISSVGSETFVTFETTLTACCNNTIAGGTFVYPLSVNYSGGPWLLHYWVQNYSGTQNSINGNLIGSDNSETWITFYVTGYVEYTLSASATKMPNDSPQLYDLPLTLTLLNQNESATGSNSTVEVCGTIGV